MVRHIVAWNYAERFTAQENKQNALLMKKELENLIHLIPGIVSIHLYIDPLSTSDSDLLLDSVLESEDALKSYIVHPEHVRVAKNYVVPVTANRKCIDVVMD